MKSFDDWWKNWSGTDVLPENTDINYAFKAGQQSKQTEVDELRKRIDEALDHAVNHGGYDDLTHIINILKGDQS